MFKFFIVAVLIAVAAASDSYNRPAYTAPTYKTHTYTAPTYSAPAYNKEYEYVISSIHSVQIVE